MSKTITFTHEGKRYTLEFTPVTVCQMEQDGFGYDILKDHDRYPMTIALALFHGAFLAHHSDLDEDQTNTLISALGNKQRLLECLAEMYGDVVGIMDAGNTTWEILENCCINNNTTTLKS